MTFVYILGGIVALIVLLAIVAPKNYNVSRSVTINKPRAEVFTFVRHLKNQDHWSPWKSKDPNMTQEFIGEDGQVGFVSKWDGNKHVGTGEQEIVKIAENERIDMDLRFLKPWKSRSDAYLITADAANGGTEVTWGFSGENKPPMNIMMLFFNMEKTVGKDFEEGLGKLKNILES